MKYRITFSPVTTMNVADVGEYFTTTKPHIVKTNEPEREIEYYTTEAGLTVVKIEIRNAQGEWVTE